MFENLAMTKTVSEKLHEEFFRKWEQGVTKWGDYLQSLNGVRYVKRYSVLAQQIDYLLEIINEGDFKDYVIRCPSNTNNFIILTKDAAERILVLGLP